MGLFSIFGGSSSSSSTNTSVNVEVNPEITVDNSEVGKSLDNLFKAMTQQDASELEVAKTQLATDLLKFQTDTKLRVQELENENKVSQVQFWLAVAGTLAAIISAYYTAKGTR